MAISSPPHVAVFFTTVLLLLSSASLSHAFLVSNIHSLTSRVAALRTARGDTEGAARARALADLLERGMGLRFYKSALNLGWDYIRNYAWRETASSLLGNVVKDLNELLRVFSELNNCNSDGERAAWVARNYRIAIRISNSLVTQLLKVFTQSGPLREAVITLQKEVDGDLLRDYLELGAADLNSLIQVIKDLFLQYTAQSHHHHPEL